MPSGKIAEWSKSGAMPIFDCLTSHQVQTILEFIPLGVMKFTYEGKILAVNDACAKLLGYTPRQMEAHNLDDLSQPTDLLPEKLQRQQCWQGEIPYYVIDKRFRHSQGHLVWIGMHTLLLSDPQDHTPYFLSFWQDISDRKQAELEYVENEKKFRQIFEEVPVGIAMIGFNQRLLKVNQTLCQMLGYSEAELLCRSFNMLTHPEDHARDAVLAKQLYYGRLHHYQIEQRCITKSRAVIWVLHTAFVIRNEQGKAINILAMLRDITKQKEAQTLLKNSLQEKEILLKEIHHRIKNNLHVIANLLDLQAQNLEDENMIQILLESQNRVYAMSLIHEQLYQSSQFTRVDFSQYLRNLVTNLLQSYTLISQNISLDIQSDAVYLNLETAIPCGLIVNELVVNTFKYAWQKTAHRSAKILRVTFQQVADGFLLGIADNGSGISADLDQQTDSLGLRLVRLLVKQLDGQMEINNQQGTEVKIRFRELPSYVRTS